MLLYFLKGVRLAQKFEALVLADNRFEIPYSRHLGICLNVFEWLYLDDILGLN